MAVTLHQSDPDFEKRFSAFLATKREVSADVDAVVREIIAGVRAGGDAALADYTRKFDRADLDTLGIAVSRTDIESAYAAADPATIEALKFACDRIRSHHERQRPKDERYIDAAGVELGWRWTAVEAVGLYVPGGTASYPSSVLMNAVPAAVAGVERLVMVVPAPGGVINPLVLVAADLAGISEIYRIGGAQAVAALAYGTGTIRQVVKIVGPGNAYVAAAKRQVFGTVGIDMIAGPSEVLVVADAGNDPDWIAADLLAQAEHDASAQSILITDDAGFGKAYMLARSDLLVAGAVNDELAASEQGALDHMNSDHLDAIALYAHHFAKASGDGWIATGFDADGIDLASGDDSRRAFFPEPLKTAADLRPALVQMAKAARAAEAPQS